MSRIDETIQAKQLKRQALEAAGVIAHPYSFAKSHTIAQAIESEGQIVTTAGRIMSLRAHGKVTFLHLADSTGRMQVMLHQEKIGDRYELLTNIDMGDFLGVIGTVGRTKTGELTILADQMEFLGKALRPLPTEWNQAEDKEVRFRKRYLDMLVNESTRKILDARWLIEKEIRRYLQDEHSFVEVETPVLQALYGGTNAKPFTTHMNALDTDYYLRLAPELYLKRLIVGGYERIFEIARNFRNEGIDQTHQPEFTMIEWYEAYADYHRMMDVAEGLVRHLVQKLHGGTMMKVMDHEIDVGDRWPRLTMEAALEQYTGIKLSEASDEQLQQLLEEKGLKPIGDFSRGKAIFSLFDHLVPEHLIQPTWIIDYPKEVSPLAKQHRINPDLVERFEGYIAGKEIGDGWSEITDAIDQRSRFENEQKHMRQGDAEAHPVDEEFLEAMEYGMPPLGGIGIGIDRLVMFLTNTWSIREVIAFPTLRPTATTAKPVQPKTEIEPAVQVSLEVAESPALDKPLPSRDQAEALIERYIKNDKLAHHCRMVAQAMQAYAKELGQDIELWYQTGLLHDMDWEAFPDEHPNKAINDLLGDYPQVLKNAIAAHAPGRTGKQPTTLIERYLFACDELSGLMHAASLMRPTGFEGMEVKSIKKKIKDKAFAANVSREDIARGFELIGKTADEHIAFLIPVFQAKT